MEGKTIKRGMTYKEFMERRKQVENSVVKVETKPSLDYNLLSNLLDYFYEEISPKAYNQFLVFVALMI